jgi:hypothetical protein
MIRYYTVTYTDGEKVLYWSYGSPGSFTEDKKEARMYSMYKSAEGAISKLKKRADVKPECLKVEPVEN